MGKQERDRATRLAFISSRKALTALTYQMEIVKDLLKRLSERMTAVATKFGIAVDLSNEEDEGDGESAG